MERGGNRSEGGTTGTTILAGADIASHAADGVMAARIEDVPDARAVEAQRRRALPGSEDGGGPGHEFNNLLSRVICLAEDIQDETDLRVIHEYAEALIVTAERGAGLVRQYMAGAGSVAADAPAKDVKPVK